MSNDVTFSYLTTAEFVELWGKETGAKRLGESPAPVPNIDALIAYARVSRRQCSWLVAHERELLVGALPFVVEKRQVGGIPVIALCLAGTDFFDYNSVCCEPRLVSIVVAELEGAARRNGADLVLLNNLAGLPQELEARGRVVERTLSFDARKDEKGWRGITSKRSLSYQHKRALRDLDYRCVHHGTDYSSELLDRVAAIHTERWKFDGLRGPLASEERRSLYYALRASAPLTTISNGEEIVAAHYGPRFGDTVIFHTPVVNVKYLSYSPVQLLLFELAGYCENNGIAILDYGLGDEAYKIRFANSERSVFEILVPITWRGALVKRLQGNPITSAKRARDWLASRAQQAMREVERICDPLIYFERDESRIGAERTDENGDCYHEAGDLPSFVDAARRYSFDAHRSHFERCKRGDVFAYVVDGDRIAGACWIIIRNSKDDESERRSTLKQPGLIYDFALDTALEQRGARATLVTMARRIHSDKSAVVRTRRTNRLSKSEMRAAGLRRVYGKSFAV